MILLDIRKEKGGIMRKKVRGYKKLHLSTTFIEGRKAAFYSHSLLGRRAQLST